MIACANKGKGWHLTSAMEWSSLAFLAKMLGTMPHGGNANSDPPSDTDYATELAMLDNHMHVENGTYHRPLPGTGPATWAHNHLASGIYDLQGLCLAVDNGPVPGELYRLCLDSGITGYIVFGRTVWPGNDQRQRWRDPNTDAGRQWGQLEEGLDS